MRTHIIYKTKNIVNGKIYIGQHTTNNLDDRYLGSGRHLQAAILKYGKAQFSRTILHICSSHEELDEIERTLVNEEFVKRPDTYNIAIGGDGGFSHSEKSKILISEAIGYCWQNRTFEDKAIIANKISKSLVSITDDVRQQRSKQTSVAIQESWVGNTNRKKTASTRMSETMTKWWAEADRNTIRDKRREIWSNLDPNIKVAKSESQSKSWRLKTDDEIKHIVQRRKQTLSSKTDEELEAIRVRRSIANKKARQDSSPRYHFVNDITNEAFVGNRHEFAEYGNFSLNQVKTLLDKRKKDANLLGWSIKEYLK